jgi:glutathione S-transferase
MIELAVFPSPWPFNPSPFCLKVETYCRLAGIEFRSVDSIPMRAPRGKLPFLIDGPTKIPDSALIIAYLKARFGDALDTGLQAPQNAKGHLLRRCCEESLYFAIIYSRWIDPDGWRVFKPAMFDTLPYVVREGVAALAKHDVRRSLYCQGYGRYTSQELYAHGISDLEALSVAIEADGFAVGERPTSFDATLYAFLTNIFDAPIESPLKTAAQGLAPLSNYLQRMRGHLSGIQA